MDEKKDLKEGTKRFNWKTISKCVIPVATLGIGIVVGGVLKDTKYNKILSECEVFAWDCFEKDIKVNEFFKLLTKEFRIAEKCPTQISIN